MDQAWRVRNSQKVARIASGPRTFMRLPHCEPRELAAGAIDVGVIGVPTDWATGYRSGARFGPEAVRSASTLLRPGHPLFQFDVTDLVRVADVGDCPVVPGYHDRTLALIEQSLVELHEKKIVPIIIGGDHSLAIAELRAAFRTQGRMSLVQFDAHRDVLDDYFGVKHFHGTVYRRAVEEGLIDPATSFQIGMRGSLPPEDLGADDLGFRVWPWRQVRREGTRGLIEEIVSACAGQPIALTFDIDFLDPAFAPGTGTPEVGGPSTAEAIELLHLLPPLNLVTASVVEIAPPYDSGDITAMAGAAIVFEILSNIARSYQERRSNAHGR